MLNVLLNKLDMLRKNLEQQEKQYIQDLENSVENPLEVHINKDSSKNPLSKDQKANIDKYLKTVIPDIENLDPGRLTLLQRCIDWESRENFTQITYTLKLDAERLNDLTDEDFTNILILISTLSENSILRESFKNIYRQTSIISIGKFVNDFLDFLQKDNSNIDKNENISDNLKIIKRVESITIRDFEHMQKKSQSIIRRLVNIKDNNKSPTIHKRIDDLNPGTVFSKENLMSILSIIEEHKQQYNYIILNASKSIDEAVPAGLYILDRINIQDVNRLNQILENNKTWIDSDQKGIPPEIIQRVEEGLNIIKEKRIPVIHSIEEIAARITKEIPPETINSVEPKIGKSEINRKLVLLSELGLLTVERLRNGPNSYRILDNVRRFYPWGIPLNEKTTVSRVNPEWTIKNSWTKETDLRPPSRALDTGGKSTTTREELILYLSLLATQDQSTGDQILARNSLIKLKRIDEQLFIKTFENLNDTLLQKILFDTPEKEKTKDEREAKKAIAKAHLEQLKNGMFNPEETLNWKTEIIFPLNAAEQYGITLGVKVSIRRIIHAEYKDSQENAGLSFSNKLPNIFNKKEKTYSQIAAYLDETRIEAARRLIENNFSENKKDGLLHLVSELSIGDKLEKYRYISEIFGLLDNSMPKRLRDPGKIILEIDSLDKAELEKLLSLCKTLKGEALWETKLKHIFTDNNFEIQDNLMIIGRIDENTFTEFFKTAKQLGLERDIQRKHTTDILSALRVLNEIGTSNLENLITEIKTITRKDIEELEFENEFTQLFIDLIEKDRKTLFIKSIIDPTRLKRLLLWKLRPEYLQKGTLAEQLETLIRTVYDDNGSDLVNYDRLVELAPKMGADVFKLTEAEKIADNWIKNNIYGYKPVIIDFILSSDEQLSIEEIKTHLSHMKEAGKKQTNKPTVGVEIEIQRQTPLYDLQIIDILSNAFGMPKSDDETVAHEYGLKPNALATAQIAQIKRLKKHHMVPESIASMHINLGVGKILSEKKVLEINLPLIKSQIVNIDSTHHIEGLDYINPTVKEDILKNPKEELYPILKIDETTKYIINALTLLYSSDYRLEMYKHLD